MVKYMVTEMQLNTKKVEVGIRFKRIATEKQLEEFKAQNKQDRREDSKHPHMMTIYDMIRPAHVEEAELNFNHVSMILPLEEANKLDLKMGAIIKLDMPERADDILKLNQVKME